MKLTRIVTPLILFLSIFFISCGPKDGDITTSVNKVYTENSITGVTTTVKDGVATLSGEVENEAAKAKAAELAKGVKGVKSVTNNLVVQAPVQINTDDALRRGVMDATKDHPSVTASVNDGVVTLTGSISRNNLASLMQTLNALNPKKVQNQLTIK